MDSSNGATPTASTTNNSRRAPTTDDPPRQQKEAGSGSRDRGGADKKAPVFGNGECASPSSVTGMTAGFPTLPTTAKSFGAGGSSHGADWKKQNAVWSSSSSKGSAAAVSSTNGGETTHDDGGGDGAASPLAHHQPPPLQPSDAQRREYILFMRLATKEQEAQEFYTQLEELRAASGVSGSLRNALLDPVVNSIFVRMKTELRTMKQRVDQAQQDLSAWKFTSDRYATGTGVVLQTQLEELRAASGVSGSLRNALLDPVVNSIFVRMKTELRTMKQRVDQAQQDLSAWKFTSDRYATGTGVVLQTQLEELRAASGVSGSLRNALLDPVVNSIFVRMKTELRTMKQRVDQAQQDLSAWKFTSDRYATGTGVVLQTQLEELRAASGVSGSLRNALLDPVVNSIFVRMKTELRTMKQRVDQAQQDLSAWKFTSDRYATGTGVVLQTQLEELRAASGVSGSLRNALLDPVVNSIFVRMKTELRTMKQRVDQAQQDLSAWKFTSDRYATGTGVVLQTQLEELRAASGVSGSLRNALLDPVVNSIFVRMKTELRTMKQRVDQAQQDLSAWKFTSDRYATGTGVVLQTQLEELRAASGVSGSLRNALLDPVVNSIFVRMKTELRTMKQRVDQAQQDLSAWKFTSDSTTGKRLMARCRRLIQENEELGKLIETGRIARLQGELALSHQQAEELKQGQQEVDEFLLELDDDMEGLQTTVMYLQEQLDETRRENARLRTLLHLDVAVPAPDSLAAGDNTTVKVSASPTSPPLPPHSTFVGGGGTDDDSRGGGSPEPLLSRLSVVGGGEVAAQQQVSPDDEQPATTNAAVMDAPLEPVSPPQMRATGGKRTAATANSDADRKRRRLVVRKSNLRTRTSNAGSQRRRYRTEDDEEGEEDEPQGGEEPVDDNPTPALQLSSTLVTSQTAQQQVGDAVVSSSSVKSTGGGGGEEDISSSDDDNENNGGRILSRHDVPAALEQPPPLKRKASAKRATKKQHQHAVADDESGRTLRRQQQLQNGGLEPSDSEEN